MYKEGQLSGITATAGGGFTTVARNVGTVTINKGTITYTPKSNESTSVLTEGDTYDWIAINE